MATKKFKCEYYQVMEKSEGGKEALFGLEAWLSEIEPLSLDGRTKPYKEDTMRLEEYYYHPTYSVWFLRFMRQRTNDVPSLSGKNSPSEFMNLEDDQFVSEDVTCLFDLTNNVLMIQKNSHSISPAGIEEYFNLTTLPEVIVHLRKIISVDSFKKVRKAKKYRKVVVRLADIKDASKKNGLLGLTSSIGDLIKSMHEVPSPFVEFTFSVGMDRGAEIEENIVNEIIDDVEKFPNLFDRARVSVIEENETKQNMVDLLFDSPKEEIKFEVERNNPVRFDAMMDAMAQKYCPGEDREDRRNEINRCIKID